MFTMQDGYRATNEAGDEVWRIGRHYLAVKHQGVTYRIECESAPSYLDIWDPEGVPAGELRNHLRDLAAEGMKVIAPHYTIYRD